MSRSLRRPAVAGVVLLVLAAAAVLAVLVGGRDDARPAAAARPGTSTAPSTPVTSAAPGSPTGTGSAATTGTPGAPGTATAQATDPGTAPAGPSGSGAADQLPPERPPVALDGASTVGGVLTGRLLSVEAVQATGTGIGNVSGQALRVTVELTDDSAAPLPLDGSYVELTTGEQATPASPVEDPSAAPLQGQVPAGGTVVGVYVFSADPAPGTEVTVRVQQAPGAPFLVFRGTVG